MIAVGMIAKRACRQWHGCLLGISISRFPTTSRRRLAPARRYLLSRHTAAPGGPNFLLFQLEELPELLHRVLGPRNRVSDRPGVLVDLVVVAALERLVAKEVDRRVGYPSRLLGLVLEVLQAVGLVPAGGKDVEGDLAADGEAAWRGRRSVNGCFLAAQSRAQICPITVRGTHVRPRWPKRSRSFSTNFSRTWCSLSYFS